MLKIDKDIPIPVRGRKADTQVVIETLLALEIGHSFLWKCVPTAAIKHVRKTTDRKFTTAPEDDVVRVWRVADEAPDSKGDLERVDALLAKIGMAEMA